MTLTELFCDVDDFWQSFSPYWEKVQLTSGEKQRRRRGQLCMSEIMTILIHFHQAQYRNFKAYYTEYVEDHLRREFPQLVSYTRFVQLIPSVIEPLCAYLRHCYGSCSGISFIDSTALAVCHNRRIKQHRVFAGLATRGKTSVDWFFGFKLHVVVNDRGQILACRVTLANTDDRQPVPVLAQRLFGKLFGDKGYLSAPLAEQLRERGIELITKLRSNMNNRLMLMTDKLLLRQRAIIETIIDQLKNISQIEHTRHRSLTSFMTNLLCGLIAYCHQPKKPAIHFVGNTQFDIVIQN
jgi:hypothetical protein